MFALVCATGLLLSGNANHLIVSGNSLYNYMSPQYAVMVRVKRYVYTDGGQYQITLAPNHRRVWVQTDTDDNPGQRGIALRCRPRGRN